MDVSYIVRRTAGWVILVGFGLFVMILNLSKDSGPVTCGGEEMRPGDGCATTVNNQSGGVQSYSERKSAEKTTNTLNVLLGAGMIVVGGGMVVLRVNQYRDRKYSERF